MKYVSFTEEEYYILFSLCVRLEIFTHICEYRCHCGYMLHSVLLLVCPYYIHEMWQVVSLTFDL